jgi:hypothetical protein
MIPEYVLINKIVYCNIKREVRKCSSFDFLAIYKYVDCLLEKERALRAYPDGER